MIEITAPQEINTVKSVPIRAYLQRRFQEIGMPLNPLTEGSFLYVEDIQKLHRSHQLLGVTLPSIEQRQLKALSK